MMWQDYVISVVGCMFAFMLIPQLVSSWRGSHVNRWSSGLTTLGLVVLVYCFFSMGLGLSGLANLLTASAWFFIYILSFLRRNDGG